MMSIILPVRTLTAHGYNDVVLVSMIHVGKRSFYSQVLEILNTLVRHGFVVLYEDIDGVDRVLEKTIGEAFDKVLRLKNQARQALLAHGLMYQSDILVPTKHWRNADDLTPLIAALLNDTDIAIQDRTRRYAPMADDMPRWIESVQTILATPPAPTTPTDPLHHLRMTHRNNVLTDRIIEYTKVSPVVVPWGSGHITEVTRLLEENGFRVTHESQLPYNLTFS